MFIGIQSKLLIVENYEWNRNKRIYLSIPTDRMGVMYEQIALLVEKLVRSARANRQENDIGT